ncbi:Fatty acid-binding protein 1 [Gryllus bimaculatus]|nr:Fatty acid-binding protein 1 [Gryllus bimaculatus]
MVTKFVGKRYKLTSSENMDAYLDTVEAADNVKALVKSVNPSIELVINGDTYTLKTITEKSTREVTFKIGEEFEQTLIDGRKIPTTITTEGNKLVEVHKAPKPSKVVREFSDDQVKISLTCDNVTAVRIYKAE